MTGKNKELIIKKYPKLVDKDRKNMTFTNLEKKAIIGRHFHEKKLSLAKLSRETGGCNLIL